jgi:hypothetical protein
VSDPNRPESPDEISRRQWLLRLGEMIVLAGVSGIVPESAAAQISDEHAASAFPPGLYEPSSDHLVHMLQSGGKLFAPPPGSETEYAYPLSGPFHPQFFSEEEFRTVTRFIEIVLGKVPPAALAQVTQFLDLWFHSAAGVQEAAQQLDPLHRALAVAYYGEDSVGELESSNPQTVARAGLVALHETSVEKHGRGFLDLTEPQQVDLITSTMISAKAPSPLRKLFEALRGQAIRGYYTSAEGLKELGYQGNAYYAECPGCPTDQGPKT